MEMSYATATFLYLCIILSDINIFLQITLKILTLLEKQQNS